MQNRFPITSVRLAFLMIIILGLFSPSLAQNQPLDELTLGFSQRRHILDRTPQITGTEENRLAESIFTQLLDTSIGSSRPYLPYEVTLLRDAGVNAYSTAAGKVYVTSGIMSVMSNEPGVWAAVLSHEIGHAIKQHHYSAYLRAFYHQQQVAYYRAKAAAGDNSANWALLGLTIGGSIMNMKLSRDEEHDADYIGLMMMAEAGYHPDFAVTLQRRMAKRVGDQSKFAAFFSSHPRWETREQRTVRAYQNALRVFAARWPAAEDSPGGRPPAIATLGKISVSRKDKAKILEIRVPYEIRNAGETEVLIVAFFRRDKVSVPGALPEYQLKDGSLVAVHRFTPTSGLESDSATLSIPAAALGTKKRDCKATLVIATVSEILDDAKPIKVKFPKP